MVTITKIQFNALSTMSLSALQRIYDTNGEQSLIKEADGIIQRGKEYPVKENTVTWLKTVTNIKSEIPIEFKIGGLILLVGVVGGIILKKLL